MKFDTTITLKKEDRNLLILRHLYEQCGFVHYKMNKFEEYDLYVSNKDFLSDTNIITFTDTNGRLLALKPDVTLSIVKNYQENAGTVQKVYYNENIYRPSKSTKTYKELMQMGLECMGDLNLCHISEVLILAMKSLEVLGSSYILDLSHLGVLQGFLQELNLPPKPMQTFLDLFREKNVHGIQSLFDSLNIEETLKETALALAAAYGSPDSVLSGLKTISLNETMCEAVDELSAVCDILKAEGFENILIDFSIDGDMGYYNGFLFRGYIEGIPSSVLSGGQYDELMEKMGKHSCAVGFAINLSLLEEAPEDCPETSESSAEKTVINVALPKGRLGEKVYDIFEASGFPCPEIKEDSRKLIFENEAVSIRYFWVKPSDVAIYVERGAADIGVAGKDILLEYHPDVYELLDLHIGNCRMAVAGPADFKDHADRTLKVATKFSNIAMEYYAKRCRDIDIIKLQGSIELAPILGVSDVIVDIVETGTTLKENNLKVLAEIVPISARLIANKASFKFKNKKIESMIQEIRRNLNDD